MTLVAGAVLGAALIASPAASAADSAPSISDVYPPGDTTGNTNVETSSIPYLYDFGHYNTPYTVYDGANSVIGDYETETDRLSLGWFPYLGYSTQAVIDSTGAAPAVGTVWDEWAFGAQVGIGLIPPLFQNTYMSSPDGTVVDVFQILPGMLGVNGNYFSAGPSGIVEGLWILGTYIPILDIPAASALSADVDMTDSGGWPDLSGWWSDLLNMF